MCQAPASREEGPGWEEIHTYAPLLCRVAKLKTVASGSQALPQVMPCVQQKEPTSLPASLYGATILTLGRKGLYLSCSILRQS